MLTTGMDRYDALAKLDGYVKMMALNFGKTNDRVWCMKVG